MQKEWVQTGPKTEWVKTRVVAFGDDRERSNASTRGLAAFSERSSSFESDTTEMRPRIGFFARIDLSFYLFIFFIVSYVGENEEKRGEISRTLKVSRGERERGT